MRLIDKDEILRDTARYKCVGDVLKAVEQATVFALPPTPPNEPLTLEELRQMDEEIVDIKTIIQETKGMVLLGKNIITFLGGCVSLDEAGITFNAYRRKPEEDTQ